jgi:phosphate transport system permease protein
MTDAVVDRPTANARDWGDADVQRRIKRRYAKDRRLQAYGITAILLAVGLLGLLLGSIVMNGYTAFVQSKVETPLFIDPALVDAADPAKGNYRKILGNGFDALFPDVTEPAIRRQIDAIPSSQARFSLRDYVVKNPQLIGQRIAYPVSLSDPFDQLYKGLLPGKIFALRDAQIERFRLLQSEGKVRETDGRIVYVLPVFLDAARIDPGALLDADFQALAREALIKSLPGADERVATEMLAPDAGDVLRQQVSLDPTPIGKTIQAELPAADVYAQLGKGEIPTVINPRFASEAQLDAFQSLVQRGLIKSVFAWELFTNADSRFPEQAGLASGLMGSLLLVIVVAAVSVPMGIAAAVYLEEFAPKNRFTDLIEVNINNLAAVPSIVFGLLGLAVFLGFFGMPRSAPLVGGLVISLMTLPTIIIATRAALKAVPPSIREAALGVGASKHQVMLHHVIPLALPGIMTGTIIGLAAALGETAPLLLIGMNAFIPSVEQMSLLSPATTLPTQVYSWADSPERGFVARTSAAIMVLLGFLVVMNTVAIVLRHKFERKW